MILVDGISISFQWAELRRRSILPLMEARELPRPCGQAADRSMEHPWNNHAQVDYVDQKKQPFSWVSWPKQNLDLDDRLSVSFSFCSAVEHFPPALLSHLGGFFLLVQLSLFSCSLGLCRLLLDLQMSCYFFRLCRQCPDSKKKRNDRKNECTRQKKAQWQMTTHVKTCQNMSKHDM